MRGGRQRRMQIVEVLDARRQGALGEGRADRGQGRRPRRRFALAGHRDRQASSVGATGHRDGEPLVRPHAAPQRGRGAHAGLDAQEKITLARGRHVL